MAYFSQYLPHLLSVLAIAFVFVLLKQLRSADKKHQHQINQLTQQLLISRSETKELRMGVLGLGKKLAGLETVTSEVSEKQDELQLIEPESKLYSRAQKMVELGANVEEIVRECELPLAEAELLVSLHRSVP
ncbi:MAG: urease accessory protein UreF [Alteromonadaceae bacterium]|jgi:urease accessory protein UreF